MAIGTSFQDQRYFVVNENGAGEVEVSHALKS